MAENNEYHIYVHIDGLSDNKSSMASVGTGSTGTDKASENSSDKLIGAAKRMVSFAAVKSTADRLINYEISQISLETGAVEYEQRLSYTYNVASQIVGAGASLVIGAATGGPAGLAIAAMGIVASGVQKVINIAQKERTLQTERNLENVSIGFALTRAGVTGSRGSNQ